MTSPAHLFNCGPFTMWAQVASFTEFPHNPKVLSCDTCRLGPFDEIPGSSKIPDNDRWASIIRDTGGRMSWTCAVQIEQVGKGESRRPYLGMSQAQATTDEIKLSGCQGEVRRKRGAADGSDPSDNILL